MEPEPAGEEERLGSVVGCNAGQRVIRSSEGGARNALGLRPLIGASHRQLCLDAAAPDDIDAVITIEAADLVRKRQRLDGPVQRHQLVACGLEQNGPVAQYCRVLEVKTLGCSGHALSQEREWHIDVALDEASAEIHLHGVFVARATTRAGS